MPAEIAISGWRSVEALFAQRPGDVRRLFFDPPTGRKAGAMARLMARERRVYRQVTPAELEKIAGTVHHGGIVAIAEAKPIAAPEKSDYQAWAAKREDILLLDRIGNTHNLGAIVRTAAFFGVRRLVLPRHRAQALPADSTYRVAEGGMEFIDFYRVPSLPAAARELREAGYRIRGASLQGRQLEAVGAKRQPPAGLVLGNEETGISEEMAAACDELIRIPGSGSIESLNVSAAAAILIYHFFGRRSDGSD